MDARELRPILVASSLIKRLRTMDKKNSKSTKPITPSYFSFDKVTVRYGRESPVLKDCSFSLNKTANRPQRYALIGESGSGKTTIVNLMLGNLAPQCGKILFNNRTINYDETSLRGHRASIGYISQNLNGMISYLNILDNVRRPALLAGYDADDATELAQEALQSVGLTALSRKAPDQLSGGELQRALIAKMIVRRPRFMILDEPTSALDRPNSNRVVDAVLRAQIPSLIVTHDPALFAPYMDCLLLLMKNGRLIDATALKKSSIWDRFNSTQELIEEVQRSKKRQTPAKAQNDDLNVKTSPKIDPTTATSETPSYADSLQESKVSVCGTLSRKDAERSLAVGLGRATP